MNSPTPPFTESRSIAIRARLLATVRADLSTGVRPRSLPRGAVVGLLVAGVVAGTGVAAVAANNAGWISLPGLMTGAEPSFAPIPDWPTNANGQTYGALGDAPVAPDLVWVLGFTPNGSAKYGYVFSEDLVQAQNGGPEPTSPAQALEQQRAQEQRYPDGQRLPMYENDGMTVIGYFTVGG